MSLPDNLLIRAGTTKYILRKAIRTWLPDSVFTHPKWGFTIPLHLFQNESYRDLCSELLLETKNEVMNALFSKSALERIVSRGLDRNSGVGDLMAFQASQQIWGLLNLAGWIQLYNVKL